MYQTVPSGDAGELITAAHNLAVAHPPGYPLFTVVGHLFIKIGASISYSPAQSMNFMSACFSSIASVFLYSSLYVLSGNMMKSLLLALLWSSSPTVLTYAVQAEVFALHNAFLALLTFLTVKYFKSRTIDEGLRFAYYGAFFCGLAMTNQHISLLYIFPLALFVFSESPVFWVKQGHILKVTLLFLFGLSPYLLIPLLSAGRRKGSWGDQTTVEGFFRHLFRTEYGTFQLAGDSVSSSIDLMTKLTVFTQTLLSESMYSVPLMAFLGFFRSNSSRVSQMNRLFLASIFSFVCVFIPLSNMSLDPLFKGVQMRFWQHPGMFLYLLASLYQTEHSTVVLVASLLTRMIQPFSFPSSILHDQSLLILNGLPHDAIVMANGDLLHNLMLYQNECEGVRLDVTVISPQIMSREWFEVFQHRYPKVTFPGKFYHPRKKDGFSLKQFAMVNAEVFVCGGTKSGDNSWKSEFYLESFGFCSRLVRNANTMRNFSNISNSLVPSDHFQAFDPISWEYALQVEIWWICIDNFNQVALEMMNQRAVSSITIQSALPFAERLLKLHPILNLPESNSDQLFKNIGIVYGHASAMESKFQEFMILAWKIHTSRQYDPSIEKLLRDRYNPYTNTFY